MMINIRALVVRIALSVLFSGQIPGLTRVAGPTAFAAANLSDLKGVEDLRTLFNRDAGKVRLVLLVSPT